MEVPLENAYALACQKIGEGMVREAILRDALAAKDAEIAGLKEQLGIQEEIPNDLARLGVQQVAAEQTNGKKALGSSDQGIQHR